MLPTRMRQRKSEKMFGFRGTIKVAPNLPPKAPSVLNKTITKKAGELRLISIARISPEKNTLFALKVLEACNLPSAICLLVFDLYGTIYNQSYWEECQLIISRLPAHIKVNFCGDLPKEKIHETLQQYHFLFMPSQGENYGHSIVESFLAGCPVIISDRTPWRNLQKKERKQMTDDNVDTVSSGDSHLTSDLLFPSNTGVGWDLPLEHPEKFVNVIEYCTQMEQEEYDFMCKTVLEYSKHIVEDQSVLKANRLLFD